MPTSSRLDALTMSAVHRLEHLTEKVTWSIADRSGWTRLPHYRAIRRLRTLTHPDHADAPWTPPWRRYVFPWALAATIGSYRQKAAQSRSRPRPGAREPNALNAGDRFRNMPEARR